MVAEKLKNMESLTTIYDIVESRFQMQHDQIDQIDVKLALVISLIGVVIAIIFQVDPTKKGFFFFAAVILLLISMILSFFAYKTEKYRRDPDPKMIAKKYINKSNEQVLKTIIGNVIAAYNENREKLRKKAQYFSISLIILGGGLTCLIIQLVFFN